jgi:hypothetical protein
MGGGGVGGGVDCPAIHNIVFFGFSFHALKVSRGEIPDCFAAGKFQFGRFLTFRGREPTIIHICIVLVLVACYLETS